MIAKAERPIVLSFPLGDFIYVPQVEPPKPQFDATQAAPGSKEKMRILTERLEKGLPLHHEEDQKWSGRMSENGLQCLADLISEMNDRAQLPEEELIPQQEKEDALCCC